MSNKIFLDRKSTAKSIFEAKFRVEFVTEDTIDARRPLTDPLCDDELAFNEIAAASREQSKGITEVNNGIQQLSIITQQNSSSSEELAASSEQLNAQSEKLNETISLFKINASELDAGSEEEIKEQIDKLRSMLSEKHKKDTNGLNKDIKEEHLVNNLKSVSLDLNDDKEFEKY